jgi:hypothetical protein
MGLLDPKLDKPRTFELLKKKGAVKAVLAFAGGHDEGQVEKIVLTLESGEETEFDTWYCGGYGMEKDAAGTYQYVPTNTPANEDEELADLLEGPINERYGSWGGAPSTEGILTWDVAEGTVKLEVSQETWEDSEEEL